MGVAGGVPDPYEYLLDDGTGNFTLGPSQFDANMTWLNAFDAQPGFERIVRVRASFGDIFDNDGVPGSDAVTVAVLEDPNDDGDPADAVLLATGTGVWTDQASNVFLDFDLDTPATVEGTFFVAVMMDVIQRASPARMDPQGQGAGSRSWLFYNPEPNLEDLGSSPFILRMSDSPFIGAWMIRAIGTGPAGCPADLAEPFGMLNIFDLQAYLGLYNAQDPAADLAAPAGSFNIFDVQAFLGLYNAGCP
ncbi:MAG: hypothetical protein D6692_07705 [Planctomycetota bacterium]|nr:MAG: hypothetical protein D6692_07705 [Planctomycetota bacterium]